MACLHVPYPSPSQTFTANPISCIILLCLQAEMKDSVAQFMSGVHQSVNRMSISYLQNERRYNYTTPKSFLEQIKLYQNLLGRKHQELLASMNRLENGLEKLKSTAQQVGNSAIISWSVFTYSDAVSVTVTVKVYLVSMVTGRMVPDPSCLSLLTQCKILVTVTPCPTP